MTEKISTPAELDALPVGSVVVGRTGVAVQHCGWTSEHPTTIWQGTDVSTCYGPDALLRQHGPLAVLWPLPDAPTPGCEHGSQVDQADGTYCASCHERMTPVTPTPAAAPTVHHVEVRADGHEEVRLHLVCTGAPDARCRMRPTDDRESWNADDPDLTPGHECWAVEWVEAFGWDDAVRSVDEVLASVPVKVTCDEGVIVEGVEPHPVLSLTPAPAAEDVDALLARMDPDMWMSEDGDWLIDPESETFFRDAQALHALASRQSETTTEWGVRRPTTHFGVVVDKAATRESALAAVVAWRNPQSLNHTPDAVAVQRQVTRTPWTEVQR